MDRTFDKKLEEIVETYRKALHQNNKAKKKDPDYVDAWCPFCKQYRWLKKYNGMQRISICKQCSMHLVDNSRFKNKKIREGDEEISIIIGNCKLIKLDKGIRPEECIVCKNYVSTCLDKIGKLRWNNWKVERIEKENTK